MKKQKERKTVNKTNRTTVESSKENSVRKGSGDRFSVAAAVGKVKNSRSVSSGIKKRNGSMSDAYDSDRHLRNNQVNDCHNDDNDDNDHTVLEPMISSSLHHSSIEKLNKKLYSMKKMDIELLRNRESEFSFFQWVLGRVTNSKIKSKNLERFNDDNDHKMDDEKKAENKEEILSSECDEISGTIDDTCSQRKFTNDKTYDFFDDIKKGPQSKIENGVKRNDTFRLNDASYKDHKINDNNHNNDDKNVNIVTDHTTFSDIFLHGYSDISSDLEVAVSIILKEKYLTKNEMTTIMDTIDATFVKMKYNKQGREKEMNGKDDRHYDHGDDNNGVQKNESKKDQFKNEILSQNNLKDPLFRFYQNVFHENVSSKDEELSSLRSQHKNILQGTAQACELLCPYRFTFP